MVVLVLVLLLVLVLVLVLALLLLLLLLLLVQHYSSPPMRSRGTPCITCSFVCLVCVPAKYMLCSTESDVREWVSE